MTFVPHLLPYRPGLLASCYVELAEPVDDMARALRRALRGRAVRGVVDGAAGRARGARHEPRAGIHAAPLGERRVVVFAAIDNLWKGAAGQAIQNLNLMLGFDEGEGLR